MKRRRIQIIIVGLVVASIIVFVWWAKGSRNTVLAGTFQWGFEESAFFPDGDCSKKPFWWQYPNQLDKDVGARLWGNRRALRLIVRGIFPHLDCTDTSERIDAKYSQSRCFRSRQHHDANGHGSRNRHSWRDIAISPICPISLTLHNWRYADIENAPKQEIACEENLPCRDRGGPHRPGVFRIQMDAGLDDAGICRFSSWSDENALRGRGSIRAGASHNWLYVRVIPTTPKRRDPATAQGKWDRQWL